MSNVFRPGSITVSTSATKIVDANNNRSHLYLTKNSTQDIFLGCGPSTSTSSSLQFSGACGTMLTMHNFRGALWGIAGAGSTVVTYAEISE